MRNRPQARCPDRQGRLSGELVAMDEEEASVSFLECSQSIQSPSVSDEEVVALIDKRLASSDDNNVDSFRSDPNHR